MILHTPRAACKSFKFTRVRRHRHCCSSHAGAYTDDVTPQPGPGLEAPACSVVRSEGYSVSPAKPYHLSHTVGFANGAHPVRNQ